jgi:YegS/Rv2252/BmrU family lipid kinase
MTSAAIIAPEPGIQAGAFFIANGGSGRFGSAEDREQFTSLVHEHFPEARVLFTGTAGDVAQHVASAVASNARLVVACGGDGTISAIATEIAGTDIVLGVVPCGTFNHFAKDLGIPLEHGEALETLRAGHIESVDVGSVNGRCFVNNSGLGLYPDAVAMRDARREMGSGKWVAAMIAALKALRRYRLLAIRVDVGGETLVRRTPVVFIGNNEYVMETPLDPRRSSLNDGQLCLYIPHPRTPLRLVWFTLRAMFGGLRSADEFDIVRAPSLVIESSCPLLRVALDGEVEMMAPPLEYVARPVALRVITQAPVRRDSAQPHAHRQPL